MAEVIRYIIDLEPEQVETAAKLLTGMGSDSTQWKT